MRLSVLWIDEHKSVWRVAVLVLLLVAMTGPWAFDVVDVPSEYPCSAPYIRLEGDLCGIPLSGVWAYGWMLNWMATGSEGLLRGAVSLVDWTRGLLFGLFMCLFLLPVVSTLLLILRGERRHRQVFHLVAWGLAASLGVLVGMSRYLRLFWVLWGVWLYVGLAASALILEVLMLAAGTRGSQA
jgi:hypothetical protein